MALKIKREVRFGPGSTAFGFRNEGDSAEDQKQYEEGRALEKARFEEGSLAQQIFDRLKSKAA